MMRRWAHSRPDPVVQDAIRRRIERDREEHASRLARMSRLILHSFPPARPSVVVLVDIGRRLLTTLTGDEVARTRGILATYDVIAALDGRQQLHALGLDPTGRRLADLRPPQKSYQLNRRGRTLRITTSLLIQGTCGVSRPLGESKTMARYLKNGEGGRPQRRLEADAKALHALYHYGRLHGFVRLRWGFLDDRLPAPWKHPDEPGLHVLMHRAHELQIPLEVVTGSAPGWADPWARAQRVSVRKAGWRTWLLGVIRSSTLCEEGRRIPGICPTTLRPSFT